MNVQLLPILEDEEIVPATGAFALDAAGAAADQQLAAMLPAGARAVVGVQHSDILPIQIVLLDDQQPAPVGLAPLGNGALIGPLDGNPVPCRIPVRGRTRLSVNVAGGTALANIAVCALIAVARRKDCPVH